VVAAGQGGLLDLALAPDFAESRLVYLSYSKPVEGGSTTAVARGRFMDDRLEGLADVLVTEARSGATHHYGSRLAFGPDGMLYVTVGDRGAMQRAQELADHVGTTLRVRPDGTVPADNPFVGRANARPEIYTYGHRNAQGLAIHPGTGVPWLNEHGPMGGDEVNRLVPGANYGWPRTTHGLEYGGAPITPDTTLPGIESSVLHWTPSIAPSGMVFYTGDRFPFWRGNAFVGALAGRHLRRIVLDGTRVVRQQTLLMDLGARIRDVRQGPDGYLYVLTDEARGVLARLEPTP
jgi:glucose/arabinose dehydrogenase